MTHLRNIKKNSSIVCTKLNSGVTSNFKSDKYVNTESALFSFTKIDEADEKTDDRTVSEYEEDTGHNDHRMSKMRNIKSEISALMNEIDTKPKQIVVENQS